VRGSRTGVFVGCSASECQEAWTTDLEQLTGYEMTGCTRSMFANRLSFFYDFKGNIQRTSLSQVYLSCCLAMWRENIAYSNSCLWSMGSVRQWDK
jgi:hypothetical protein